MVALTLSFDGEVLMGSANKSQAAVGLGNWDLPQLGGPYQPAPLNLEPIYLSVDHLLDSNAEVELHPPNGDTGAPTSTIRTALAALPADRRLPDAPMQASMLEAAAVAAPQAACKKSRRRGVHVKTRLCLFAPSGKCASGSECAFAHHMDELNAPAARSRRARNTQQEINKELNVISF